ncbi:MAG TPA: ribonuclease P protein component [Phycisphaerae bacterium]|nr:ribonuclease P protein component [Phycisphaerae bacterium]
MAIAKGQWAKHRLSGQKNFARVFAGRHSAGDANLVVYALANELGRTRMGLSVGRKVGNAVARNRVKRLLREAFRAAYDALPKGYDFICIPRPGKLQTLENCERSLRNVAPRAAARSDGASRSYRRDESPRGKKADDN